VPPKKVFLSYTHRDLNYKVVSRLRYALESLPGVEVWVDTERIRLGERVRSVLSGAIKDADFFVPVLSEAYKTSDWALFEVAAALQRQSDRKPLLILPVRIDRSTTPQILHGQSIVELADNFERGFKRLADLLAYTPQKLLAEFDVEEPPPRSSPILTVSSAVSEKLIAHLASHPNELHTFDRRMFEELVAELFDGFGYEVELTKRTRDGGRDVIAIRHREVEVKYLIECKRPDPGHKIGVRPVRELFGVKADEGATKAILATTAEFTPDALLFFGRHRWELEPRDHSGLLEWLGHYLRSRAS
jgi:HJR/Mrr/RecB family endonuclease